MSGIIGTTQSKSKIVGKLEEPSSGDTAHAWVHWNGGSGSIEESYNVSGVSNPETGQWTVTFASSAGTANHSTVVTTAGGGYSGDTFCQDYTASTVKVMQGNGSAYANTSEISVITFSP